MDFLKIFIAAFSATNVMTTFSYLVSHHFKTLFKEPVMLNYVMHRAHFCIPGKLKNFTGWLAHYIIGLFFVMIYAALWRYGGIDFSWGSALVFGIASAFIAMLGWTLIYRLPDHKPNVPIKEYYLQLFFAHVIFALVVVGAFKIFDFNPIAQIGEELSIM